MKIAYLCADFGIPIRGNKGASVHVRELVAALKRQGHEVRIFTSNPYGNNALSTPTELISSAGLPDACVRLTPPLLRRKFPRLDKELRDLAYNLNAYWSLGSRLRAWLPDCIYERYSLFNLAGLAVARSLGVPHLLEVNAPLRLERARTTGLTLHLLAELFDRQLFHGADRVLVVSKALQRYVDDRSARAGRVVVIPNAVDTSRFRPRGAWQVTRARLGLDPAAFVVGFAGSLKPWHGTEILLDAFAALHREESRARLLIVGDGPQAASLRDRAAHLRIEPATIFTGAILHGQMPSMLGIMDVAAAPYLEVPDFYFSPLKLYEYMASGLAVVASDVGDIATLVQDGETGLLSPAGDAPALADRFRRLMCDTAHRERIGRAARAKAEQHSWDHNARLVTDLAMAPSQRAQEFAAVASSAASRSWRPWE
jgi:glycosyltransferase involved in cell wall biosynthesis